MPITNSEDENVPADDSLVIDAIEREPAAVPARETRDGGRLQALASSSAAIVAASSSSRAAAMRSRNCSTEVALAIGPVTLGRAISHAMEIWDGVALYARAAVW